MQDLHTVHIVVILAARKLIEQMHVNIAHLMVLNIALKNQLASNARV